MRENWLRAVVEAPARRPALHEKVLVGVAWRTRRGDVGGEKGTFCCYLGRVDERIARRAK